MPELTVNGEPLLKTDLHASLAQLRLEREAARGAPLDLAARLALREEALQLLVDRMLMIQEARRLSLSATEEEVDAVLSQWAKRFDGVSGCRAGADTPEARQDIENRILVDKVLNTWRTAAPRPKIREIRDYYRKHTQEFYTPETVHASHIVRHFENAASEEAARQSILDLRALVDGGQPFGQLAASYSDCPESNGDLGWFARGVMVSEFDDVVFTAPVGQLTPVFRTEFGFHFALVHARKPAGVPAFDEVRERIENALWLSAQDQQVGRAISVLRATADIRRGS